MLKAFDSRADDYVISIDPCWENDVEQLRDVCRADAILCPGCKQPVTLRAGNERIWHFAHRIDSNCPLKNESAAILRAREMLYKLLRAKFGERVSLEDAIPGAPHSECADCVVSLGSGKIGYCIIEKQLRNRSEYMHVRQRAYNSVQWILLPQLLQKNPENPKQFLLSATARELAAKDGVNTMYAASGNVGSLCCADVERGQFLLARGLECVHEPNVFEPSAYMEVAPERVIISNKLGQLMVADEVSRFKEWQRACELAEIERREAEAQAQAERKRREAEEQKQRKEANKERKRIAAALTLRHTDTQEEQGYSAVKTRRCLKCNADFMDWEYIQFDGCVCRECGEKDRNERLRSTVNQPTEADKPIIRESTGRKELPCIHCKRKTRDWVAHAYNAEHPSGICLCCECNAAGLAFPYEDRSQTL